MMLQHSMAELRAHYGVRFAGAGAEAIDLVTIETLSGVVRADVDEQLVIGAYVSSDLASSEVPAVNPNFTIQTCELSVVRLDSLGGAGPPGEIAAQTTRKTSHRLAR